MTETTGQGLKYFRPQILSGLANLTLKSRQVVDGVLSGLHDSTFRGYSVEFTEHRQYSPGDDIRHIDWKAYGKSDRYLIKEYEEETNLKGFIMVDASASMDYGPEGATKWEYACCLAASLSYLLLRQRDAAGLLIFSDQVKTALPPVTRKSHLKQIDQALAGVSPGGRASTERLMATAQSIAPRRGLVIYISDLLDQHEEAIQGLKRLMYRKNEIIVFHILDNAELEFPFTDLARFEDLELGDMVMTDPLSIRKEYRLRMQAFLDQCAQMCRSGSIEYQLMDTSVPLQIALAKYLSGRTSNRGIRR